MPRHRRPGAVSTLFVVLATGLAVLASPRPVDASFTGSSQTSVALAAAGSFYREEVLADAPVGYWRLGDASGATATAVTGTAGTYQGTGLVRGVTGTTRDGDRAVGLPPVLRQVTMPRLVQDDLSVEFWFTAASAQGGSFQWWQATPLVDNDKGGGGNDFGVGLSSDGRVVAGANGGGPDVTIRSGTGFADGAWHYVVFTRTKATGAMELWVDGTQAATGTTGTSSLTDNPTITLGRLGQSGGNQFTGAMDEVAVYASVLSPATIAAHLAAAAGASYATAVTGSSPAGYWRLGESTGTTAAAVIGSAGSYDVQPSAVAGATGDGDLAQQFLADSAAPYVQLPRDVSGSFSLECWFRSAYGTSTSLSWFSGAAILGADVSGGDHDFGVTLDADGRVMAGTGPPDTTVYSGTGFADGSWHHVVFTRDGTTGDMVLYVDGVQRSAATGGTATLTGPSEIDVGREPNGSQYLVGEVDDVAVYPTVLPAARVLAHYQRGGP